MGVCYTKVICKGAFFHSCCQQQWMWFRSWRQHDSWILNYTYEISNTKFKLMWCKITLPSLSQKLKYQSTNTKQRNDQVYMSQRHFCYIWHHRGYTCLNQYSHLFSLLNIIWNLIVECLTQHKFQVHVMLAVKLSSHEWQLPIRHLL